MLLYPYENYIAEIDVITGNREGLVFVDFEFKSEEEANSFIMPDFCLMDVTNEEVFINGSLLEKSYGEMEKELEKYGYKKLSVN
ncbi:MAG TPA: hypothetical protein DCP90_07760 [Clostridiales bacterium]|nr:MAG: hypothetical protein A2Y22_01325 [Clostridiales bacterium GWD2_32_59]HAN10494.1 hypothetical protein [Clostridiales bacterium]